MTTTIADLAADSPLSYEQLRAAKQAGALAETLAALTPAQRVAAAAVVAERRGCSISHALEVFGTVMDEAQAAAEDNAELARQLVGELNQVESQWAASIAEGRELLAAQLGEAYDAKSAQVRSLGYDIGPGAAGALCLYDMATQRPLDEAAEPAENPYWTACRNALGREPRGCEFIIRIAEQQAAFHGAGRAAQMPDEIAAFTAHLQTTFPEPDPEAEWREADAALCADCMCYERGNEQPACEAASTCQHLNRPASTEPAAWAAPPFAPNLLPLHPELIARVVAILRLGAPDMPRALACEASLVADVLVRAGRPATGEWGCRRAA